MSLLQRFLHLYPSLIIVNYPILHNNHVTSGCLQSCSNLWNPGFFPLPILWKWFLLQIFKVEITSGSDLSKKKVTFEDLFRRSKFCQLGDVSGSILIGRVVDVVSNDLYIDFGGKFNCVCPRPLVTEVVVDEETKEEQPVSRFDESYTYGTQVKLQLKEFEMAEKFLGSARHTSLLEADAVLLGHVTQKEVLQEELQENILF